MSERQQIERAISEFGRAYREADLQSVMDYYTDDLVKVRYGAPPETKEELKQRLIDVFDRFQTAVEVETDEICSSGELAFSRGSFHVTLTPKAGGSAQQISRRYLEIWRKEQGRWLVARTMDNVE